MALKLGFIASGGGTNLQAILEGIASGTLPAKACLLVCNNSAAGAMRRASAFGMPTLHLSSHTHPDPGMLDEALSAAMEDHGAELIVCAGYNKKLGRRILQRYQGRILNIHPSLLPKYGGQGMYGMNVHEAVLAAHDTESGPTVHLVNEEYDRGPVVAQARVPVLPGDTPESLQVRVLGAEHRLYAETLRRIALGEIDLDSLKG